MANAIAPESDQSVELFVNCPKGLEGLLMEELNSLGAHSTRETVAGVYASGDMSLPYRVCLWSRLANRVLLPLGRFDVKTAEDLYSAVKSLPWHQITRNFSSLAVDFGGKNDHIRHTQFGAQTVKDGIVDRMVDETSQRPDVDLRCPDLRINVRLAKDRAAVSLDLSGESLHRRGYRVTMVPAPLKENLAAALLVRAGWPEICAAGGPLIDPMCGSGTLLIEGAMMAADIAPGLGRLTWGFEHWSGFDQQRWDEVLADARQRRATGLEKTLPEIRGYDKDRRATDAAMENVTAAGLDAVVRITTKPLEALKKPTHTKLENGLLITNPPYGERWGEIEELRSLYQQLGEIAKQEFAGWQLAVFTGNHELAGELRLRSSKKYKLYNGTIPAELLLFELREQGAETGDAPRENKLPESAAMLANRIQKNQRKLQPWLKREGISCYRLYDSDIPEYAVAIDIYGDAIHVQEYAPPATIDERQARQRIQDVRRVLLSLYPEKADKLFFKERRRQKGESQYQRQTPRRQKSHVFQIKEGPATLEVNLSDYLDSGLFLDHRPTRQMVGEMAQGKRFLNLFCYTAAATVHAALGGAKSSLSVDMSNTYLEWAQRNFALNNLDSRAHRVERADCLAWLAECKETYDLIFLDPPTFSNSKKMETVLDIQRDHGALIRQAMSILSKQGALIFSNNFRRFKMDEDIRENYQVENITAPSIPQDFQRNSKIHNCWLIRRRQ